MKAQLLGALKRRPSRLTRPSRFGVLCIIMGLLVAQLGLVAQPNPASAQTSWQLVWSDEFNGTSVDPANWTFETGGHGWGNNELQYYTNGSNASVSGGVLTITANRVSSGYSCWYGTCQYTSTRMNTKGKREFQYGRIEARMALPMGKGIWPAFWMLGANFPSTPWPNSGEIDIMEHVNNENVTHGTIHWDSNGYASYGGPSGAVNVTTYHTYAIEWDSSAIRWFLDGTKFWEANILNNINSTEEFHKPFFMILNLAVGGNWPGSPDSTTVFPARVMVDYVRVYKRSGTTTINPYSTVQAESYSSQSGTQVEACSDTGGGQNVGWIANGDYLVFNNVDFGSTRPVQIQTRVASGAASGVSGIVEYRIDSLTGPLLGSFSIANTGGWQSWRTVPASSNAVTGVHNLYVVFKSGQPSDFVNLNWFYFQR
ncbi:MAG TPA: carbohydrate-binding protein [Herpetosiphonaceae bacterium]